MSTAIVNSIDGSDEFACQLSLGGLYPFGGATNANVQNCDERAGIAPSEVKRRPASCANQSTTAIKTEARDRALNNWRFIAHREPNIIGKEYFFLTCAINHGTREAYE